MGQALNEEPLEATREGGRLTLPSTFDNITAGATVDPVTAVWSHLPNIG